MKSRLTLKTRFTLVAAGAVAAVALAITAVAFIAIRTDLQNQVQPGGRRPRGLGRAPWPSSSIRPHPGPLGSRALVRVRRHLHPGDHLGRRRLGAAATTPGCSRRARRRSTWRRARRPSSTPPPRSPGPGRWCSPPSSPRDWPCRWPSRSPPRTWRSRSVGATLATLSAIGVLVATLLGWAVAKTGLAPVARLARVAEEVSLTGDPGRRVEVGRRDELGRLATTFNAMLSALQRSLDAQRRLVSDASHELRTPLASLRINVDVLTENPDLPAGERKEVLARVTDQVAELSRLVASVTDLARGEPPAADVVPGPAQRRRRRRAGRGAARLAEDGVRRATSTAASSRAAPTGCASRSRTCWTTRPSSARRRGRSRCG